MVTVEVPAGVPPLPLLELFEPPPQPANPKIAIAKRAAIASNLGRTADPAAQAANTTASKKTENNTPTTGVGLVRAQGSRAGVNIAVPAEVVIVTVVDTAAPLGVTVAGLNAHAAPCGSPEHTKLVVAVKPPDGVSMIVAFAELPAATVPLAGLTASVKSGVGAPPTVTVTAVDVDDANVPSPW